MTTANPEPCECEIQWGVSCQDAARRTYVELRSAGYDAGEALCSAIRLMLLRHPEADLKILRARLNAELCRAAEGTVR